ncbi:MAG TPA: DUF3516 domain-containing protein [Opitutaceae bacterium]
MLEQFLAELAARGLTLYPEQEEAILELLSGNHVILNTPTGSGKSLVASALHRAQLAQGRRSVYTSPIKALVNEKFLALCREFGAERVGLMTGDASVNPGAPVLCCTAEILANIALAEGDAAEMAAVVMDEFHYYSDAERGWAWQVPLLTLARSQFLLMSATLGNTAFFEKALTSLTGVPAVTVRSDRRPVPLEFTYSETPLQDQVQALLTAGRAPIYLVYFTQRSAAEAAQDLMSLNLCSREEKAALQTELEGVRFSSPYGKEMRRWLRQGIGLHHAGLLPRYRLLVESLAQRGLLKVICGTDTLGVGINVPIRTVVFTQLWKYDGQKAAILSVRDFRQIGGRAGRKGFDDRGFVVVQAPEHVIANKIAEEKGKKGPKQRAPEGSVSWDEKTFQRLQVAPSEELTSRFRITQGMLLLMFSRAGDGCRAARHLIAASHETAARKRALVQRAWQLFRAMLTRGIVTLGGSQKISVAVDLQSDFSLHQALSLYLIDTVGRLTPEDPDYHLDVLTLCESIVEDPEMILRRQVDQLKTAKLEEMKAADVPYEERMAKLDEIEHPKPKREFVYETFNAFAAAHPWIEDEHVRPKSIAREMYERYLSFADYVREYGLERIEGLLLRHLSQVWKVLAQTVPQAAKSEAVLEMEDYFRELIRGIDSSLMDEWERLRNPSFQAAEAKEKPARPETFDVTRDREGFRRLVRTAILGFLQDVAARDWERAAERMEPRADLVRELETAFGGYALERGRFRLDPEGRSAKHTHWDDDVAVAQVLIDGADENDWEARFEVLPGESRAAGRPVLRYAGLIRISDGPS